MSARVPTSRAYWNLRAEQVMDKVFEQSASDPGDRQLVPVHVAVHEPEQPSAVNAPAALPTNNSTGEPSNSWLIPLLAGVAAAAVVSCGWLIGHWQHSRAQLEQERITLLKERLRERPMAPQTSIQPTTPVTPTAAAPVPEQVTSLKPLTLPIRTIPQLPVSEAAPPAPATPATPDNNNSQPDSAADRGGAGSRWKQLSHFSDRQGIPVRGDRRGNRQQWVGAGLGERHRSRD
ncbi:MAG: hypothetical protein CMN96_01335 [Synechococcus sp. MED850]|nr:hypothetical protein [Synechococcus sp. MED850]OUW99162.1 MAG: hypothetical protein CBD89_00785 [Cyanobacteria bacterium TMED229]